MTREENVAVFNEAAGNKKFNEGGNILSFATGFSEEIGEFGKAIDEYLTEPSEDNREALVKEWADVQVVLSNLAWFFSIDGQVAFNRVHQNNMTKLQDGNLVKDENGKVLKPDNYVYPSMRGL